MVSSWTNPRTCARVSSGMLVVAVRRLEYNEARLKRTHPTRLVAYAGAHAPLLRKLPRALAARGQRVRARAIGCHRQLARQEPLGVAQLARGSTAVVCGASSATKMTLCIRRQTRRTCCLKNKELSLETCPSPLGLRRCHFSSLQTCSTAHKPCPDARDIALAIVEMFYHATTASMRRDEQKQMCKVLRLDLC